MLSSGIATLTLCSINESKSRDVKVQYTPCFTNRKWKYLKMEIFENGNGHTPSMFMRNVIYNLRF